MKHLCLFLGTVLFMTASFAQTIIVPYGSVWKYLDNGSDQGNAWNDIGFNDISWASGNAELGYGDGDEATVVSYGPDAENKYITTYFRKLVNIANPSSYINFILNVHRDDGIVVYINGTEVYRNNMPAGTISYNTLASVGAYDDGDEIHTATLANSSFINGDNIIAVEIHQDYVYNSDISFDLQLIGTSGQNIAPVAKTGFDQVITLPANSVTLNGSGSADADGTITTYAWSKVSGPASGTITNPDSVSTTVTGLVEGSYTFRLAVTDNEGATATDDLLITVNPQPLATSNNVVDFGATWKYLDNGSNQGTNWLADGFSDGSWASGPGELGYGDGDEATVVSYGPDANNKYITTYFRKLVNIANPSGYINFTLNVRRDDGIVVYINGTEVYRDNMPAGPVSYTTLALGAFDDGNEVQTATIASSNFINGDNIISVEIHQNYVYNSDISFDLQLIANASGQNIAPVADAGSDQTITLPINSVTLDGSASGDADGTITSYAWSELSGPGSIITSASGVSTTVTGLLQGTYVFRLTVTDNDGATATDDVTVTVNSVTNLAPVAKAGSDQVITLPANSVTLNGSGSTDADGTIATYAWTKVSGPSSGTISSPNNVSTSVTGLIEGTYIFRLRVTDNDGAPATDDVSVIVNAATSGSVTLVQGPYLQMGNGSAVTLRWRTDMTSDSKISVGTTAGTYTTSATNSTSTAEHEVRIAGLSPDRKYYYSFGSSTQTLQAGSANFFTTAPPASTIRKIRVAAFGDCGTNANGFQSGTLSAYQAYVGSNPAELMLLLGDNAYSSGTDGEYTSKFFNIYSGNILKNHILFPAPGNHDYASSSSRQADHDIPYYSLFTLPSAAECGGVASGTEAFYSYNWGNIHFLSLDSYGFESGSTRLYDTLGPQVTWVKKDLAANTSKWTIAYWHHPPFTMGSHNSDSESELVKIRQNFIRILERYGVDMVLCGHSHDYERSYLLRGYYGNESSFDVSTSAVTGSSGYYDGSSNSCPYNIKSGHVNHGTVYVVAGSSGNDGGVQSGYPHNALPFAVDDGGLLYFEVENNRLDAKFIRRDGVIADKFTILKDAGKTSAVSITSGQTVTLTASWKGNYSWSTGAKTQSITVSPATTTSYACTDGNGCITDHFTVNVAQAITQLYLAPEKENSSFTAYPTPVKRGSNLIITSSDAGAVQVMILNDRGQKVKQLTVQGLTRVSTGNMRAGVYYIRSENAGEKTMKKIMVID